MTDDRNTSVSISTRDVVAWLMGIVVGIVIGVIIDNVGVGIAAGAGIGIAFAIALRELPSR
jgi:hypothetical protein